jgi:hypothetical protein
MLLFLSAVNDNSLLLIMNPLYFPLQISEFLSSLSLECDLILISEKKEIYYYSIRMILK